MTSITVEMSDVWSALRSVAPHASTDPEEPIVNRVRLVVGKDLTVTATNRFTAAAALVSIEDHGDGELDNIDLSTSDVKEITQLFKPAKDIPDQMLRIAADDEHVTITDCSGLFDGKQYRLPRNDTHDSFPAVPKLIAAQLAKPVDFAPDRLEVNGVLLGLFTAAAKAYRNTLTVEPTGDRTALVIACGESFVGLLMPINTSEDRAAELDGWRRGWRRRLPHVDPDRADEIAVAVRASLHEPSHDLSEHDEPKDDSDA